MKRSIACLVVLTSLVLVDAAPASAVVGLTVTADDFDSDVRVGSVTTVTVTVSAQDQPTSGPVHIRITARGGRVLEVDNLGFFVDCRERRGAGICRTVSPLEPYQIVELAASVKVTGVAGRTEYLRVTATATSPADGVSDHAVEVVPVSRRGG